MFPMYKATDKNHKQDDEDGVNNYMDESALSQMLSFSPIPEYPNADYEDSLMTFRYEGFSKKIDDYSIGNYEKNTLSAFSNEHDPDHCHYIREPRQINQKQQPKQLQYKYSNLDLYNKNCPSSLKCVQRYRTNGKNNNVHKIDLRSYGHFQHTEDLECSISNDYYTDYDRNLSDDHYQHYYSYHYSHKPINKKLSQKQDRCRRVPPIRTMPFQKNGLKTDSGEHKHQILKEKPINNMKLLPDNNNEWESFKVIGNITNLSKDTERRRFENSKYYENGYKIKQSTMISHFSPSSGSPDIEKGISRKDNNYELDFPLSSEDETIEKLSAVSPKKYSSPSKNRRVLIYNSQSPRLSQLMSHKRIRRSKLKLQNESKEKIINQHTSEDLTLSALNEVNPHRISKLKVSAEKNQYKDVTTYSSDETDNETDFDTVSNFDISDDSDISSDSEECYRSHAFKLTHSLDAVSVSPSCISSLNSTESLSNPNFLLVASLFPNVPPYLAFSSNTQKGPDVPVDLYRILKWRVSSVMPRVVRTILSNSGMRLLKKTNDWMGVWGKHLKSPCFKTIRPYQKINHLPGSFKIGRKDSCWKNLVKQMAKHGKKEFGFMPKTYIIPHDLKQLRKSWPKYSQRNVKWIIKPPASARGSGIRVVDRWAQIPKRKALIVQKYIERPLLINGSKFDLRLYVLVTSIHPLRVYMYHNGLARFASVKYSDKSDTLNDRCMHLTNYSINKFSSNYSKNEDVNACHGHKWTIKSLWTYLANRGVRTELLWDALRSLVLRTILAGENSINNMIRNHVESKYSCFELFGFDVLLDSELVPWLLEVNISPSLHSELPLDAHVKAPLVQSVLNTALYNIPPKISLERQKEIALEMSLTPGPICYDKRIYINYLSRVEKIKHSTFTRKSMEDRDEYISTILEHLTPDDVRCLIIAEDELARSAPLERIFPTSQTHKYLKYTETPRYYNRLLDAWETKYSQNREEGILILRQLCEERYHLQVPQIPTKKLLKRRTRAIMKKIHPICKEVKSLLHSNWGEEILLADQSCVYAQKYNKQEIPKSFEINNRKES